MTASLAEFVIPDGEEERMAGVHQFITMCVPGFESVTRAELNISILSGGLTNQLYRAKHAATGTSVVVRIFGKETDRLISRAAEQYWQSSFLKTFGKCANGLAYEFLEGFEPLAPDTCRNHTVAIGRAMATLHREAVEKSLFAIPYATEPQYALNALKHWVALGTSELAVGLIKGKGEAMVTAIGLYGPLDQFQSDAAMVVQMMERVAHHVPVVPCHNDLLALNIMVNPATKELRFIDFEYMKRGPYLYDIANHFAEWAGFECKWEDLPTPAERKEFLRAYIDVQMASQSAEERSRALVVAEALTPLYILAAHMVWSAWSLVQGAFSVIEFDYVTYGATKYARMRAERDQAISAATPFLASQ